MEKCHPRPQHSAGVCSSEGSVDKCDIRFGHFTNVHEGMALN